MITIEVEAVPDPRNKKLLVPKGTGLRLSEVKMLHKKVAELSAMLISLTGEQKT